MRRIEFGDNIVEYWDDKHKVGIYAMDTYAPMANVWIVRIYTDEDWDARAIGLFFLSGKHEADALLKKIIKARTPEELRKIHSKIKKHAEKVEKEKDALLFAR